MLQRVSGCGSRSSGARATPRGLPLAAAALGTSERLLGSAAIAGSAKDFERLIDTTTAMAVLAIIQMFIRRLANPWINHQNFSDRAKKEEPDREVWGDAAAAEGNRDDGGACGGWRLSQSFRAKSQRCMSMAISRLVIIPETLISA